jgi:OFA family oxalate/formate antiporter-like MFS transporter
MTNNRWLILAAGCLIQTVLGGIYAWSTFVHYLSKDFGLTSGQCGLIFGVTILVFTSVMIFAGRVLVRKGPRFTALIASVLFAIGYLVASLSGGSFAVLLLSLGVITGCGIGFGYVCPLSVGMKWFPERKGLVTGVAVAGFGAGAIFLSSIAEHYLLGGMDVLVFFRWFGICSGAILFAAALLLHNPPGIVESIQAPGDRPCIRTWPFYLSSFGIFSGTFAGLLIIGNLTPLILKAGLTEQQAALAVGLFAAGNGVGRIVWGKLFDHLNYRSIPLSLFSLAVVVSLLLFPLPAWMLMLAVVLTGFCFGANFVIYASAISRFFGVNEFPRLYPICFMAYGIAGVVGPGMGGWLADQTGTYSAAIYICIALVSFAGIFTFYKLPAFKHQQNT